MLNKQIFETIYYGALEASCELAERDGPYETYAGCPVSKGLLQYDMWEGVTPTPLHDWAALKEKIATHGVRNSLLLAPMPTASTAQILGNNESVEAYTSNIYTRRYLVILFLLQRKKRKIDIYFVGVNFLLSIFIRNNFQSNDVADMCGCFSISSESSC